MFKRCLIAVALSGAAAVCADTRLPSKVTAVTVYSQEALVERRAETALVPGQHRLILEGFPAAIDPERLRVLAGGSAKVKITGIRLEPVYLEKSRSERVKVLEEKLRDLEGRKAALVDKKTAVGEEVAFLSGLKNAASAPDAGKDRAVDPRETVIKRMTPQDYAAFMKFYRDSVTARRAEMRDLDREQADLDAAINVARQELAEFQSGDDKTLRRLTVDVDCAGGGDLVLSASYVSAPASWRPVYEVRVVPDQGEVVLTQHALVAQQTGEDWESVLLTLSTAKPSLGAAPPVVAPWYLDYVPPQPVRQKKAYSRGGAAPEMAAAAMASRQQMEEYASAAEPEPVYQAAEAETRGASVAFKITSRETIPTRAESPRKVTAAVQKFPAALEYETAPRLAPQAFLRSKVSNGSDLPLLSGEMTVYLGQDYAGAGVLPPVAPGEEFSFHAGVDEGIKVEVENVKADKGEKTLGKDRVLTTHYRMKLQNFRKDAVQLTVVDRVPVSRNEKVKVSTADLTPKPDEESQPEQGLYRWKVSLAPKEKKEITVKYKVTYPPDGTVPGL